jgi:hypothetical protein
MDTMDKIDAMERGFVGSLALDKVKPEAEGKTKKMTVERSEDRLHYVLYEDLERVLEARVTEEEGIHVFAAGSGCKTFADVPAFTLTHDTDKKNWTIASRYCAKCAYRNPFNSCQTKGGQKIGFIKHGMEEIGEGRAMCMDVDIPQIGTDGQSDIWCSACEGPDARIELSSLRPKWNEKINSLCMDFKGRVEAASAKNFQLCLDEKPVLVYGKKKNGTFALEFEHPLSTAQAFTIALSTLYWT